MGSLTDRLLFIVEEKAGGKPTTFAKKAGIPPSTFQNYINGRIPHVEHLIHIREVFFVNIDWLLSGEGEPFLGTKHKSKIDLDEDPEITDLLEGARKVLKSGNVVAFDALERNIRYFSLAIDTEKRLQEMEKRISQIETNKISKPNFIREGDPPEQKEELLKKRAT